MRTLMSLVEGAQEKVLRPSGGCHKCPRQRVDFVPATLRPTKIIVLGEGPGEKEVEKQEGFVGKSGETLRGEFGLAGITDFSLTNTIHCRPPNNATPKANEIACCLSELVLDEIRGYPIVVLVGSVALKALFPDATASHFRGNVAHHPDFPGQRFYMLYHPSFILRNPWAKDIFKQQVQRLGRIVKGEPPPDWQVFQGGNAEMWEVFDEAMERPLLSLDFETTGLPSWDPLQHIRSMSFTADGNRAVFVHEDESHWIAALEKIRAYVTQQDKTIVGSHVAFDAEWFESRLECHVVCGIQEVSVVWYQARQYKQPSLKELTSRELDGYRYLVYSPDTETDLTLLGYYNGEDAIYSYRLFKKGMKLLQPKTRELVTRSIGPVTLCLQEMKAHGFLVRKDYRAAKIDEYGERRREVLEAWHKEDPEFHPTVHESGKGLEKYIFKIHGLPVTAATEKGTSQITKMTIKGWIQQQGATYLRHLLELREIDKILSTYLTGYDKQLDAHFRVHSSYPTTRVDTGRTSSSEPNLQNIPRKKEIRDLFGVPNGSWLLEADLNQIEFRIMVCLAKDSTGINAYNCGEDAHTTTAKAFTGGREPTKEERSRAKPINFSLLYGGDWYNVQRQARVDYDLDWDQALCTEFTNFFFATYRQLPIFHRMAREKLIQNRGWFESVVGHIYHYRGWDSQSKAEQDHIFRAALNSEAQGPAAQICFACMASCRRLLIERGLYDSVHFVNHVHDSAFFEIDKEEFVQPVVEAMEDAVEEVYAWVKPWFVVPLVMDYKLGHAWGSLEDYEIKR